MVYINLVNQVPFRKFPTPTLPSRPTNIETHIGNELSAPTEPDNSISMVSSHLDQYCPESLQNAFVRGVGIQYFIPLDSNAQTVIGEMESIADEFLGDGVGFVHRYGNFFLGSCSKLFPTYRKSRRANDLPLSQFMELDFNILKVEEAFGFPIRANHLRSPMFWNDYHRIMIDQLRSQKEAKFDHISRQVISFIESRRKGLKMA